MQRYVTVSLIMAPEKADRGEFLEVLQGYLHIGKELTEFQLLLKEWFFTCMAVGTMFFYGLQVMLLLGLQTYWEYLQEKRERERVDLEDDASDNLGLDVTLNSQDIPLDSGNSRNDGEQSLDGNAVFFECDGPFEEGQEGEWEDLPTQTTTPSSRSNRHFPNSGSTRIPDDDE
jgi:hypothetical protein